MFCLLRRSKVRSEVLESREGAGKKYCEMGQGREMLIKTDETPCGVSSGWPMVTCPISTMYKDTGTAKCVKDKLNFSIP